MHYKLDKHSAAQDSCSQRGGKLNFGGFKTDAGLFVKDLL